MADNIEMPPPLEVKYKHCPTCGMFWPTWNQGQDLYHGTEMMCPGEADTITYTLSNVERGRVASE